MYSNNPCTQAFRMMYCAMLRFLDYDVPDVMLFTYLLHGAESFLRSQSVLS